MSAYVYLGNYTFHKLAEEHDIDLTAEELKELEGLRTDSAKVDAGTPKCHVFDMPRMIVCGTQDVQDRIVSILRNKTIHGQIQLAVKSA